jgi:hypothetical protein
MSVTTWLGIGIAGISLLHFLVSRPVRRIDAFMKFLSL